MLLLKNRKLPGRASIIKLASKICPMDFEHISRAVSEICADYWGAQCKTEYSLMDRVRYRSPSQRVPVGHKMYLAQHMRRLKSQATVIKSTSSFALSEEFWLNARWIEANITPVHKIKSFSAWAQVQIPAAPSRIARLYVQGGDQDILIDKIKESFTLRQTFARRRQASLARKSWMSCIQTSDGHLDNSTETPDGP